MKMKATLFFTIIVLHKNHLIVSVCNYYVKPKPNCVEPCFVVVTPFGHWMCQKRKAVEFSKETTWDVQFFYYMFDSRWQHMTKNDTNLVSIRYWKLLTYSCAVFIYVHTYWTHFHIECYCCIMMYRCFVRDMQWAVLDMQYIVL